MTTYRVIDTETASFEGGVLEIGSIDVVKSAGALSDIVNPLQSLCNPGRPIEFGAMAVHHITEDMVKDERPCEEVFPGFLGNPAVVLRDDSGDRVAGYVYDDDFSTRLHHRTPPDVFVAHNAAFDSKMLPEAEISFICTLKLARHVYPKLEGHSNQRLRYELGLNESIMNLLAGMPHLHAHRALYDAVCTAVIFRHLASELDWDDDKMLRISAAPSLLHHVNWGKYAKRMTYEEVANTDPSYFQWALNNMGDLDEDRRHTMTYWLKKLGLPLTQRRRF